MSFSKNASLRERIEKSRSVTLSPDGGEQVVWHVENERVSRVVLKNARGHAYYEMGEPMLDDPDLVSFVPLQALTSEQRIAFEQGTAGPAAWPEMEAA